MDTPIKNILNPQKTIKQVIIVRTRYPDGKGGFFKPRTGKLIAQGAHASMKVLLDLGSTGFIWRSGEHSLDFESEDDPNNSGEPSFLMRDLPSGIIDWIEGIFTKIVVGAPDEETLVKCYQEALAAKLPCALIEDIGATEFHGIKTKTAVAIGPAEASLIDLITGNLSLL